MKKLFIFILSIILSIPFDSCTKGEDIDSENKPNNEKHDEEINKLSPTEKSMLGIWVNTNKEGYEHFDYCFYADSTMFVFNSHPKTQIGNYGYFDNYIIKGIWGSEVTNVINIIYGGKPLNIILNLTSENKWSSNIITDSGTEFLAYQKVPNYGYIIYHLANNTVKFDNYEYEFQTKYAELNTKHDNFMRVLSYPTIDHNNSNYSETYAGFVVDWKTLPENISDSNGERFFFALEEDDNPNDFTINYRLYKYSYSYEFTRLPDGDGTLTLENPYLPSKMRIILNGGYKKYMIKGNNAVSKEDKSTVNNGHDAVDLGLSVKWATTNVGALVPEEYGDHIAWGETKSKKQYNWKTYKWCKGDENKLTKYCMSDSYGTVDNKEDLELDDDAANVAWGSNWRMPTHDEFEELRWNCKWVWTYVNKVRGYKITSKINNNSIFLPAAGHIYENEHLGAGWWGKYLSRNSNGNSTAQIFDFSENRYNHSYEVRSSGYSIRPVCE